MSERVGLWKRFTMRFTRGAGGIGGFRWGLSIAQRDIYTAIGNGAKSSVVIAPLQWMMRTFPEAPLTVDRRMGDKWEQEDDHELLALIERPNLHYSGDLLWRATVAQVTLDGNAYWVKIRDGFMRVVELWWIPSSLIEPKWPVDGSEFISHYEYKPGGDPVRFSPDDVVHFRWDLDPENDRKGLSPLAAVLREVFADDEAGRFAAALLNNMGVPGLIIAPDGDPGFAIPDDDLLATKRSIQDQTSGKNRGAPLVFGAPTSVQQFGFNPQQMDMRTLRKVPEERVTGALGVAAIVAGLGAGLDRSTFANFKEAREASYETAIIPLQRLLAAEIKHQLLPDFEVDLKNVRARFDLDEVRSLQEDQNAITERKIKELQAGAITLNDYLRETGREALPDKQGDLYLRAFNVVEVLAADLGKPPEPAPALSLPVPPPGQEQLSLIPGEKPPKPGQRQLEPAGKALDKRGQRGNDAQRRLNDAYQRSAEHMAGMVAPRIETVLDGLGMECMQAYLRMPKSRKEASDPNSDLAAFAARIVAAVDVARHAGKLKSVLEQHYAQVVDNTISTLNVSMGMHVNLPDYVAREIVGHGGTRAGLVDLSATAKESIFNALVDGRVAGEGQAELGRRIRSLVPAGPFPLAGAKYRSELIAGTETRNAQRISAIAAYKQAGATQVLAFDAQGGGDTDLHCELRNGQTFAIGEVDAEIADSHPNCTLSFAPVFA